MYKCQRMELREGEQIIPGVTQMPERILRNGKRKRGRKVTVQAKHLKAAANISSGMPLGKSLIDAGYSPSTARVPSAVIQRTPAIIEALKQNMSQYEAGPQERAKLIRNRLVMEIVTAKSSDAIRACEVAGKDREVRLFEPDVQIGVFSISSSDKLTKLLTAEVKDIALSGECPPQLPAPQPTDNK